MRGLTALIASMVFSAPAFAADIGTYRPGTPYHFVTVPSADICESQCAGDAQCRSWNYVLANPEAPGLCEFLSSITTPVASAVSISGVNNASQLRSPRLVEGDVNTIRVGAPVASIPVPQHQLASPEKPRVMRQPVPHTTPRLNGRFQQSVTPTFKPALDGHSVVRREMPLPRSQRAPARVSPDARHMIAGTQMRNVSGRPPVGQVIPAPEFVPATSQPQRGVIKQSSPHPLPAQRPIATSPRMPRASVANPVTWQSAPQTSLYGRLNDDVITQTAPLPAMPTVQSRPTQAVTTLPLAGAKSR